MLPTDGIGFNPCLCHYFYKLIEYLDKFSPAWKWLESTQNLVGKFCPITAIWGQKFSEQIPSGSMERPPLINLDLKVPNTDTLPSMSNISYVTTGQPWWFSMNFKFSL